MNNDSAIVIRQRLRALTDRPGLDPCDREARVQVGLQAYENARSDGLCHEGAWECAVEAMSTVRP